MNYILSWIEICLILKNVKYLFNIISEKSLKFTIFRNLHRLYANLYLFNCFSSRYKFVLLYLHIVFCKTYYISHIFSRKNSNTEFVYFIADLIKIESSKIILNKKNTVEDKFNYFK